MTANGSSTSRSIIILVLIQLIATQPLFVFGQTRKSQPPTFKGIKLLVQNGDSFSIKAATVTFVEESVEIRPKRKGFDKTIRYSEITKAEYSYSKRPRWKSGLGLGAASLLVFYPLILVAIPLGFSKTRSHWLTVRTKDDFVVLKLNKRTRKVFVPLFETKSGVTVDAVGEDK